MKLLLGSYHKRYLLILLSVNLIFPMWAFAQRSVSGSTGSSTTTAIGNIGNGSGSNTESAPSINILNAIDKMNFLKGQEYEFILNITDPDGGNISTQSIQLLIDSTPATITKQALGNNHYTVKWECDTHSNYPDIFIRTLQFTAENDQNEIGSSQTLEIDVAEWEGYLGVSPYAQSMSGYDFFNSNAHMHINGTKKVISYGSKSRFNLNYYRGSKEIRFFDDKDPASTNNTILTATIPDDCKRALIMFDESNISIREIGDLSSGMERFHFTNATGFTFDMHMHTTDTYDLGVIDLINRGLFPNGSTDAILYETNHHPYNRNTTVEAESYRIYVGEDNRPVIRRTWKLGGWYDSGDRLRFDQEIIHFIPDDSRQTDTTWYYWRVRQDYPADITPYTAGSIEYPGAPLHPKNFTEYYQPFLISDNFHKINIKSDPFLDIYTDHYSLEIEGAGSINYELYDSTGELLTTLSPTATYTIGKGSPAHTALTGSEGFNLFIKKTEDSQTTKFKLTAALKEHNSAQTTKATVTSIDLLPVDLVTINTFMPHNNIEDPRPFNGTRFKGDNRHAGTPPRATWDEHGSHRTQHKFMVIANQAIDDNGLVDNAYGANADGRGGNDNFVSIGESKSFDASTSLDPSGDLTPAARADTVKGAPLMIDVATAPKNELWIESTQFLGPKKLEVVCKSVATNPLLNFLPGISAIDYEITLVIDRSANTYSVEGDHDGFPAHEIYINGSRVYEHDPMATGEGPNSLLPPKEHNFSKTGSL